MRADPRASDTLGAVVVAALVLTLSACEPAPPATFEELAQAHLPQIEGTIDVPGLQADVEVIRDFPLSFSREAVDRNAAHRLMLRAGG